MERRIRVAMIMGSDREGRFCDTVARWVAQKIEERPEYTLDIIDPLEVGLPNRLLQAQPQVVRDYRERIAKADAFVVVVPEYNHGYPAAIKNLIDHADEEWYAKPVAFVSYGGISGGLRAVEQLRLVFAELHAVTIRDTVSFHLARQRFDERGEPVDPVGAGNAMNILLDRLAWWAETLARGRERLPYVSART